MQSFKNQIKEGFLHNCNVYCTGSHLNSSGRGLGGYRLGGYRCFFGLISASSQNSEKCVLHAAKKNGNDFRFVDTFRKSLKE